MSPVQRKIKSFLKSYLLAILALLITVFSIYYILLPQTKSLWENFQKYQQDKVFLSDLTKKRNLLESISQGSSLAFLASAETALPSEKDAASIMTAMENLSVSTMYTIDKIDLNPGVVSTNSAQTSPDVKT